MKKAAELTQERARTDEKYRSMLLPLPIRLPLLLPLPPISLSHSPSCSPSRPRSPLTHPLSYQPHLKPPPDFLAAEATLKKQIAVEKAAKAANKIFLAEMAESDRKYTISISMKTKSRFGRVRDANGEMIYSKWGGGSGERGGGGGGGG